MRVTQEHSWSNISFLGIHVFDIEEPKSNLQVNQLINPHTVPLKPLANDQNWGLGKYKLKKIISVKSFKKKQKNTLSTEKKRKLKRSVFLNQINDKSVKVNLYKPGKIHFNVKSSDWEIYKILSWYGINQTCKSFIQVGIKDSVNSLMIVDKFPCSEFYIIESWRNKKNNLKPHLLSDILRRGGYRGHIRFVSGDENTALSRLIKSTNNKLSFDLSILQLDSIKENFKNYIKSIISYSSDEGVLVLIHNDKREMIRIMDKNKYLLEKCDLFYTKSGLVSLIFKNKFQIEEKSQNENLNIIDLGNLPDWNWLININYKRVLFSPSKYVYHLIKFFRLILRKI